MKAWKLAYEIVKVSKMLVYEFMVWYFQSMLFLNNNFGKRSQCSRTRRRQMGSWNIEKVPNTQGLEEGKWVTWIWKLGSRTWRRHMGSPNYDIHVHIEERTTLLCLDYSTQLWIFDVECVELRSASTKGNDLKIFLTLSSVKLRSISTKGNDFKIFSTLSSVELRSASTKGNDLKQMEFLSIFFWNEHVWFDNGIWACFVLVWLELMFIRIVLKCFYYD